MCRDAGAVNAAGARTTPGEGLVQRPPAWGQVRERLPQQGPHVAACDRPPGPRPAGCADLTAERSSSLLAGPHGRGDRRVCLTAGAPGVQTRGGRAGGGRPLLPRPRGSHVPGRPGPLPFPCLRLTYLYNFVFLPELGHGVLCRNRVCIVFWLKPVFRVTKQMHLQRAW